MREKKGHVTIYDIAENLGVSATTVSRALKNHHSIGKKTIKKVKQKAREMGYQPNAVASNLRKSLTNTIGIIVPHINRPFISSLISGIEEICSLSNYNVIISQSFDDYNKEKEVVNTMFSSRVDGLIVSLAAESVKYEHFQPFLTNEYPLVFADRISLEVDTDKVIIDNFEAAYQATTHLIKQGYKKIGHLAGVQQRYIYQKRLEGFISAMKENDLPIDENLINYSKLTYEDGDIAANKFLESGTKPDAVFASNDRSAIGFMQAAEELGYDIPNDIGVVGFNNDPISSLVKPKLTTVDHPAIEIGKKAAEIVLDKILKKSHTTIPQTVAFSTKLIVRQSSVKNT